MIRALGILLVALLATEAGAISYVGATVRRVTTTTAVSTTTSTSSTTTTSTSTSSSSTSTSTTTSTSTSTTGATTSSTTTSTSTSSTTTTLNPPQAFLGDPTSSPNTSVTVYNSFPPIGTWVATEVQRMGLLSAAGTVYNFRVVLDVAPGSGKSYTFNVRINGATASGCTISDSATTCQVATSTAVSAGDRIGLQSTPSGTPASVSPRFSLLFSPTTADEYVLPATYYQTGSSNAYLVPFADWTFDSTENILVAPVAGAIKKLYAWCNTNVAGGATRVFTGRVAGSDGALTCTINAGASTCNDTSNSMSVSALDGIAIHSTVTGTPGTQDCAAAVVWDPTTADRFLLGSLTGNNSSPTTGSNYQVIVGFGAARITTTETDVTKQAAPAMTVRAIGVALNASTGSSSVVSYTLRKNGSNSSLTCSTTAPTLTCSATTDVSVSADDMLSTELTAVSGSPSARAARIGYAATIP